MQYACWFAVTATVFPAEDKYTQLVEMKNFFKIYKFHILLSFYYFFIIILPFVFIYIYMYKYDKNILIIIQNYLYFRAGRPQPDNREGNERCLGVLNNFYQDGVKFHDIACHHRKPVICEA